MGTFPLQSCVLVPEYQTIYTTEGNWQPTMNNSDYVAIIPRRVDKYDSITSKLSSFGVLLLNKNQMAKSN